MKNYFTKSLVFTMSAASIIALSGCGEGGGGQTTSQTLLGDGNSTLPPSNTGKSFHTAFITNISTGNLAFYISSVEDTDVNVSLSDDNSSFVVHVPANTSQAVTIPSRMMQSGTGTSNKMIHITSEKNIVVTALNQASATTDASLLLPDQVLAKEYYTAGYYTSIADEFSVVAVENNTTVHMVLPNDTTFDVTLNVGESYQYQASADLTGAHITSDKNIAVISGNECANIPLGYAYCDHIEEQMLPVNTWEKTFVTVPLKTRLNGDSFRFVASVDGTQINKDGVTIATLNAGQYYETIITGSSYIEATQPIMALQYSNGTTYDGVTSDPFMTLVPAINQFDTRHIINTPSGFTNYVNIVVPTANIGNITMDGTLINSSNFTPVTGNTAYSTAQLSITEGSHVLSSSVAFGLVGYGYAQYDSYGYPSSLKLTQH